MTTDPRHHDRSPGLAWLAARTGRDPDDLLASPATTLVEALRELTRVAVQAESEDLAVRDAARDEIRRLREEIAAAPPPSEAALATVAGVLRDAARRAAGSDGTERFGGPGTG